MRRLPQSAHALLLAVSALLALAGVTVALVVAPSGHAATPPAVPAVVAPVVARVAPVEASRARPLAVRPVAALKKVLTPDLLVTTTRPLTPAQRLALGGVKGVVGSTVVSAGVLWAGDRHLHAYGVDPSTFRAFTPRTTAQSNALWDAVARGELAPSYAAKLPLGQTVAVVGTTRTQARVGAVAEYGLPNVDLLLEQAAGRRLGLRDTAALVAAPDRGLKGLKRDLRKVLGSSVTFTVLRPEPIVYRRPATYRELYILSAKYCPGLDWKVLAAIGQIESGHGRNVGPSSAGALGPMQFMPATWAGAGVDGDGDGRADIMSAYDAVPAASLYLCRNGAGHGGQALYNAIFSYNHADWYVKQVLALAARYA